MKSILNILAIPFLFIASVLVRAYKYITMVHKGDGMRNMFTRMAFYHVVAFAVLWINYRELSVLPLGGLVGLNMCYIFYQIDRRGFNEVPTISLIDDSYDAYHKHIRIYAILLLTGYAISWYALR